MLKWNQSAVYVPKMCINAWHKAHVKIWLFQVKHMLKLLSVEMGFSELQLTPLHTLLNYSLVKPSAVSCFNGVSQMDVVLPLILNLF